MGEKSSAPPFDTQRAVEELVAVGMPPDQAGVIVRLHLRWADRDLATGKDIDRLRAETGRLRESMELLRENMDLKFQVIEQRIDARYETLDRKIDERYGSLDRKIDERYASLDHKIDARCSALETKIAQSSADTIKWVTTSQIGTAAVYLAALLAVIEF